MNFDKLYYQYRGNIGFVKFYCEDYISFCISVGSTRLQDVCLIVPKSEWENLIPVDSLKTVHDLPLIPDEYAMITK